MAEAIVVLAGTPDDLPSIDVQLEAIVQLAADRVGAADHASVTALRDNVYTTVAASSELADAVDQAQYAEQDGPCLQSLVENTPVTVPDMSKTMAWPGFRQAAVDMGLRASVSIPPFAGSGTTIAPACGRDQRDHQARVGRGRAPPKPSLGRLTTAPASVMARR